jgi:hypothetical protein
MVLRQIYKDGSVNKYRTQGSLVVHLIMCLLWAPIYHRAWVIQSFQFWWPRSDRNFTQGVGRVYRLQFVPEALLERAAVIFEGMTGMLYPALMIAGLVVLELQ